MLIFEPVFPKFIWDDLPGIRCPNKAKLWKVTGWWLFFFIILASFSGQEKPLSLQIQWVPHDGHFYVFIHADKMAPFAKRMIFFPVWHPVRVQELSLVIQHVTINSPQVLTVKLTLRWGFLFFFFGFLGGHSALAAYCADNQHLILISEALTLNLITQGDPFSYGELPL